MSIGQFISTRPFWLAVIVILVIIGTLSYEVFRANQLSKNSASLNIKAPQTNNDSPSNRASPTPDPNAEITQETFNNLSLESANYLIGIHKKDPSNHCPNVVVYYDWKLDFYKRNPDLPFAVWTNKAMDSMKKDNYYYWSCGVIFVKTYSDQLGKLLAQNNNNQIPGTANSGTLTPPSQTQPRSPTVIAPPVFIFPQQQYSTYHVPPPVLPFQHIQVPAGDPTGDALNSLQQLDNNLYNIENHFPLSGGSNSFQQFENNLYNIENHFPIGN